MHSAPRPACAAQTCTGTGITRVHARHARHAALCTHPVRARRGGTHQTAAARLQQVLDAIDALNAQDPRSTSWQGQQTPYELAYSSWLTDWVLRLEPQPSEELRIVARGQHVQRWKSPRSDYPPVRARAACRSLGRRARCGAVRGCCVAGGVASRHATQLAFMQWSQHTCMQGTQPSAHTPSPGQGGLPQVA